MLNVGAAANRKVRPEDCEVHRVGRRPLTKISKELRLWFLIETELAHVGDYAHDLPRPGVAPGVDVATERALAAKFLARERFVDDHHALATGSHRCR